MLINMAYSILMFVMIYDHLLCFILFHHSHPAASIAWKLVLAEA